MTTPPNHNTADQSGADERSNAAFDKWYVAQSHQLTNEQLCRLIWNRGWQAAQNDQVAPSKPVTQDVLDHCWEMYKVGQISADHTDKQVFEGVMQSFATWLSVPTIDARKLATPQPFPAPAVQEHKECSGDSASCPENEGYGCCKPNPAVQSGEFPKLPRPWFVQDGSDIFSAHQMVNYARKAIAQTAPAVAGEAVQGILQIMGDITTLEPDNELNNFPMALLITFDSTESIRKAISDGFAKFDFSDDAPSQGAKQ